MVFQSQKLSFDGSPLDGLDLEGPQADLSENDPIKPPMKADGEQDPIQAFNFELEELLKRGREQTPDETQNYIKVELHQSDNFSPETTEEKKQSFREFLYQQLGEAPLPPYFDSYVRSAISSVSFALNDLMNEQYLHNYSYRGSLGVILRCDTEKCDSFGPYASVVEGLEQRKGVTALQSIDSATLLIIGSIYDDDLKDRKDPNTINILEGMSTLAKEHSTPVYYFPTETHTGANRRLLVEKPGALMHSDGSIAPF